jgi:hypothetical protein
MTRTDIETMLTELHTVAGDLQESGYLLRKIAAHLVAVSEHLQHIAAHTDAAMIAGLKYLHSDEESL